MDYAKLDRLIDSYKDELIEKGLVGRVKNTEKLLAAIEASKSNDPARLLAGLAIPNVGRTSARAIMGAFGSIPALMAADKEQLLLVPDIGDITAEGILQFFADAGNRALIERLRDAGLNMEAEKKASSGVLAGKTYVITGSVMAFANRDARKEAGSSPAPCRRRRRRSSTMTRLRRRERIKKRWSSAFRS